MSFWRDFSRASLESMQSSADRYSRERESDKALALKREEMLQSKKRDEAAIAEANAAIKEHEFNLQQAQELSARLRSPYSQALTGLAGGVGPPTEEQAGILGAVQQMGVSPGLMNVPTQEIPGLMQLQTAGREGRITESQIAENEAQRQHALAEIQALREQLEFGNQMIPEDVASQYGIAPVTNRQWETLNLPSRMSAPEKSPLTPAVWGQYMQRALPMAIGALAAHKKETGQEAPAGLNLLSTGEASPEVVMMSLSGADADTLVQLQTGLARKMYAEEFGGIPQDGGTHAPTDSLPATQPSLEQPIFGGLTDRDMYEIQHVYDKYLEKNPEDLDGAYDAMMEAMDAVRVLRRAKAEAAVAPKLSVGAALHPFSLSGMGHTMSTGFPHAMASLFGSIGPAIRGEGRDTTGVVEKGIARGTSKKKKEKKAS